MNQGSTVALVIPCLPAGLAFAFAAFRKWKNPGLNQWSKLWTCIALIPIAFVPYVMFSLNGYSQKMKQRTQEVQTWPNVMGKVVYSAQSKSTDSDKLYAVVRYEYTVGGKRYDNTDLDLKGSTKKGESFATYDNRDSEVFDSIVRYYSVGKKVSVLYNPSKPEESVLIRNYGTPIHKAPIQPK